MNVEIGAEAAQFPEKEYIVMFEANIVRKNCSCLGLGLWGPRMKT